MRRYKLKDDVDLKELEKFGYISWYKEGAEIKAFKMISFIHINIYKDNTIDFQLPINSKITRKDIKIEDWIQDLKEAGLVEKESD